jgi:DNA uptake protein ComE-like DNA-binding protein
MKLFKPSQKSFYRFQSATEIKQAAKMGFKIDVNRATVDDWLKLPGISIRQAQSLVELTGMGVQLLSLEDLAAALSLSLIQVKIWEPVLGFYYYDTENEINPVKINPNTAFYQELSQIPEISADLALMIIENREEKGKYLNLGDFGKRLNLNPEAIARLMYYLKFL